ITAQGLLNVADPGGYELFVIMSVLVSISFAPILLAATPAPYFDTTKPMSLRELFRASPLGMVGIFLLGGVFSAMFGMAPVYATEVSLTAAQTSIFVAVIYLGGMVLQYPIGWVSDRVDRRMLILGTTGLGTILIVGSLPFLSNFILLCCAGFVVGGVANPLYSLLIAYTNDFLEYEDMAAASGGLIFANGLGAILGPIVIGWLMGAYGPWTFFLFIAVLFALIAVYAVYRMTQRAAPSVDDTYAYTTVLPQASPVAVELAQEVAIEMAQEDEEDRQDGAAPA
ncbi:MAG: MFS transporter, partial [Pseudomonadota bacterium]